MAGDTLDFGAWAIPLTTTTISINGAGAVTSSGKTGPSRITGGGAPRAATVTIGGEKNAVMTLSVEDASMPGGLLLTGITIRGAGTSAAEDTLLPCRDFSLTADNKATLSLGGTLTIPDGMTTSYAARAGTITLVAAYN